MSLIGLLKLDAVDLSNRRHEVLMQVMDAEFLAGVTGEELKRLRTAYRTPNHEGILPNFGHIVVRFIDDLL